MKDTSATLESGRDILLPRKQCGVKHSPPPPNEALPSPAMLPRNVPPPSATRSLPPPTLAMANFVVDPEPFVPPPMFLEDGGPLRRTEREVYVTGGVTKIDGDCAIAVVNGDLSAALRHQPLHDITHYIATEHQLNVRFFALHPHGSGVFRLRNAC
jgi:hypothetical protein